MVRECRTSQEDRYRNKVAGFSFAQRKPTLLGVHRVSGCVYEQSSMHLMHVYSNCGSFSVTYGGHTTFFPEGTVVTTGTFYGRCSRGTVE